MKRIVLAAILAAFALPANADTLYVAGPPPVSPGHPMHLGADHKASQVGDLVAVQFNFSVNSTSSDVTSTKKDYNIGLGAGTGNAAQSFLRFPTGLQGGTGTASVRTKNGTNTFVSAMMATVTNVLPSGALAIEGDQHLIINGQNQVLHVTGLVRTEDIDGMDSVLATRIANVQASFSGDFQEKNKGVVRRVLDFLF
ncbi:MAG: hypothetical protein NVSMB5_13550 [Candidatus Velthaea sp.]